MNTPRDASKEGSIERWGFNGVLGAIMETVGWRLEMGVGIYISY